MLYSTACVSVIVRAFRSFTASNHVCTRYTFHTFDLKDDEMHGFLEIFFFEMVLWICTYTYIDLMNIRPSQSCTVGGRKYCIYTQWRSQTKELGGAALVIEVLN